MLKECHLESPVGGESIVEEVELEASNVHLVNLTVRGEQCWQHTQVHLNFTI